MSDGMDAFRFEHEFRFTEERYVELHGVFRRKTRLLRLAAVGAAGVACLFSPYTLLLGILLLFAIVLRLFAPGWLPRVLTAAAAQTYRQSPWLHDSLTCRVDQHGLKLSGPLIEARVPWRAAHVWEARDGWLRISAPGVPNFWFPLEALKEAGVHDRVMDLCRRHARRFNEREG